MVDSPSLQNPAGQSDWARAMANNFLGSQSCGSQSPAAKGLPTPTGSPQGQHLPWNHWQYEQGSDDEVPTAAAAKQQPSKSPNQEEAVKPRKKKKENAAVAPKKDAKPPKKAKTKEGSKEVSKEGQEANVDWEEEPPKKKKKKKQPKTTNDDSDGGGHDYREEIEDASNCRDKKEKPAKKLSPWTKYVHDNMSTTKAEFPSKKPQELMKLMAEQFKSGSKK